MSLPAPDASATLDAARERVVHLLTDRFADDTLTVEQFEAELDRLHRLTDIGSLQRMAGELTSGVQPAVARDALAATPLPPHAPSVEFGWQYGELVAGRAIAEARMLAIMSSSKRTGVWSVPRVFRAFALMSEAVIDLRYAVIPADGCEIEVSAIMANVKVLLPPEVEAEVAVSAFMGSAQDGTHTHPAVGHGPRVRVTGSAMMAEVKVLQGMEAELAALEMND